MILTAKYQSNCCKCGMQIDPGMKIEWSRGSRPYHTECPKIDSGVAYAALHTNIFLPTMPVKKHMGNICDNTGDNIYECECREHRGR